MASVAGPIASPAGRLNEKVVATNGPWWLTVKGVLPFAQVTTADSGTIVSCDVETAEPVDEPRELVAMLLSCWLRTESAAISAAVGAAVVADAPAAVTIVVPITALVDCVPAGGAPDVLI